MYGAVSRDEATRKSAAIKLQSYHWHRLHEQAFRQSAGRVFQSIADVVQHRFRRLSALVCAFDETARRARLNLSGAQKGPRSRLGIGMHAPNRYRTTSGWVQRSGGPEAADSCLTRNEKQNLQPSGARVSRQSSLRECQATVRNWPRLCENASNLHHRETAQHTTEKTA